MKDYSDFTNPIHHFNVEYYYNGGGEYIYVSVEWRAVVGERKIDYSVVIFLEKEPLKPWKSRRLGSKFSLKLTKNIPKPWNIPPKIVR